MAGLFRFAIHALSNYEENNLTFTSERYPLLWVVTAEEQRAIAEIEALAKAQRKRLLLWSGTIGLVNPALPDREDASKRDPLLLLRTILEDKEPCLWVLRDFHPFLKDAQIVRRLRGCLWVAGE